MAAYQSSDVTAKIQAYRDGTLSEDALVEALGSRDYAPVERDPDDTQTARVNGTDGSRATPGSFQEVTYAHDIGLLPGDVYARIVERMREPHTGYVFGNPDVYTANKNWLRIVERESASRRRGDAASGDDGDTEPLAATDSDGSSQTRLDREDVRASEDPSVE